MVKCPSCDRQQQPSLLCAECGAPIGAEVDCFAALGLERKLTLDPASLERIYHDLGRRIHPDRFAAKPVALRDASLRATALLTRAYRTLRDPAARGRYWLELHGHKLADNNKNIPASLAEIVFEVQDQLAELRAARNGDGGMVERLRGGVDERQEELSGMIDEAERELARNFARWDAGHGSANDALVNELKTLLSKIAYLKTLLRDVARELDSAQAA